MRIRQVIESIAALRVVVPSALLVVAAPLAVRAAPITYTFTGTVVQAAYGMGGPPDPSVPVVVGQLVPITITLDGSFPNSGTPPSTGIYSNNSNPSVSPVLSVSMAGLDANGFFTTVTVVAGKSLTIDSGTPLTGAGFDMTFTGAHAGVLPTDAIPLSLNPGDFDVATFSRTVLFSPTDEGFSGTLAKVPAPASLPLLAAGVAALLTVKRRVWRTR